MLSSNLGLSDIELFASKAKSVGEFINNESASALERSCQLIEQRALLHHTTGHMAGSNQVDNQSSGEPVVDIKEAANSSQNDSNPLLA